MLKRAAPLERLISEEVCDGEGDDSIYSVGGMKIAKKSKKSKSQKISKFRKSSKSGKSKVEKLKKPSKSGKSPNFDTKNSGPNFLTPKARSAFNRLQLAFIKAPILWHFDPESHIRIVTDVLGYAIGDMLSQLASRTSSDWVVTKTYLSQWHLVAFFFRKMISAKTWYKTHNSELLAIVEAFKTWCH